MSSVLKLARPTVFHLSSRPKPKNHEVDQHKKHHHHDGRDFRGCGRRRQPTPDPATAGLDTFDPSGQEKWHSIAILRWRPRFLGRFFIDSLLRPHRPLRRRPISGFPDVDMLQNPPRQSILTRRGGGSERKVRNELLACFFMSVLMNYVAGPHRPLRRQPISSFLDVGMLQTTLRVN